MLQSIMTSRGQVTIPSEIRERLSLSSGHKLEFILDDEKIIILPINKSIRSLKGLLPKPTAALTCQEMDGIIRTKGE